MSDEGDGLIEKTFIETLGAKFPFIKAKSGVNEAYGIKFFPSVYVIDATGAIFSMPDDRMPSEGQIEELLKAVTLAPKMPDDPRYDPLRAMWKKKDHAKLKEYLTTMLSAPNLDAAMREVYEAQQKALEKRIESQVGRVAELGKGPDYYGASARLAKIEKEWKGFPAAVQARAQLDRFAADATIRKEIAAGKALAKLLDTYDASKQSQAKKLKEELVKFAKKHAGTHAGEQAQKMVSG